VFRVSGSISREKQAIMSQVVIENPIINSPFDEQTGIFALPMKELLMK
jgi:hypothetical protein